MFSSFPPSRSGPRLLTAAGLLLGSLAAPSAYAAEPPECLSPDPAQWPAPAKPYFMIAFDTSGSMSDPVNSNNSCGYPNDRTGHGRCAIKNTVEAYGGQANFGLASYAREMKNCNANCYTNCTFSNLPNNSGGANCNGGGCGPEPQTGAAFSASRAGANILVPMLNDSVQPPLATNVAELVSWVDNNCSNNKEIFANGCTPLNGILRDMFRYYSNKWTHPSGAPTFNSPLTSLANGERSCRSVNVILVTDGDETCDADPADPVNAAAALLNGFTKDGISWKVKTFVINFAGGSQAKTDQIAAAGGTGASAFATNEADLAVALSTIIGGSVKPEVCNNTDDNCNGCTDEGFKHLCNVQQAAGQCCTATTPAQRTACLASFQASITAANPQGNLALLPCTTAAQSLDPTSWLCFDPGEKCDNLDNNCQNGVDEGINKCGSPLHCPQTEVCNGQDDDCNNLIDDGNACNGCVPSPEICDGCDNDCDGLIDETIATIPCGLLTPPNCVGQISCKAVPPGPLAGGKYAPGTCVAGGGFNTCNNSPQTETCDGIDNNCNGLVDDGIAPVACVPAGTPGGLVFGGNSQCKKGTQSCGGACVGFVGPSTELCDGIDNDCDGQVDEGVSGVGLPCGINQAPCTPGLTACVGGALVCQGGVGPQPEVCDGKDNNCNGQIDESPLADAPAAGQNGCWDIAGNCCTFPAAGPKQLSWCPPPGATCTDNGTLTPPCNKGTLACAGLSGWICQGPKDPAAEVCDGIDNNCNGQVDEGNIPQVGQACGSSLGLCKPGVLACTAGVLDCVGDVPPSPELCDGLDNDCDGNIDNGIVSGGPCTVTYDTTAYPGDRTSPPCQPGIFQCNGMGGGTCVGGVGPSPEICDGIDNDCDGVVDEPGPAPNGIDGSANPTAPPAASIGDGCGIETGTCKQGKYGCINGSFACLGSQAAAPEECDCLDNDCDGVSDNPNGANGPPLCSMGKDCVKSSGGLCQCAQPCSPQSEFPCPAGQNCQMVNASQTGMPLGTYCVADPCTDCANTTTKDANGDILCGPTGTAAVNCVTPPVCTCKGQSGCQEPCFGVTCAGGQVCTNYGPKAGTCVVDSCYNNPCQGCDKVCNQGSCIDNPCKPGVCPADQECKPSADFTKALCLPSCASVTCPSGQACKDGACAATCDPPCTAGNFCDTTQTPPVCAANECNASACPNGGCCDPHTAACGNCPCEGVLCPNGQQCKEGQCLEAAAGTGGAGGGDTTGIGGGGGATGASTTGAGGGGGHKPGFWGLPSGGGGCTCTTGPAQEDTSPARWSLFALAIALGRLRKRTRKPRAINADVGEVR